MYIDHINDMILISIYTNNTLSCKYYNRKRSMELGVKRKFLVKFRKRGGVVRTGMEGADGSQKYRVIRLLLKRKKVCL